MTDEGRQSSIALRVRGAISAVGFWLAIIFAPLGGTAALVSVFGDALVVTFTEATGIAENTRLALLNSNKIQRLTEVVEDLVPERRVARYDPRRSRVTTPGGCRIESECSYEFHVVRSMFGASCQRPTIVGEQVKNGDALPHSVDLVNADVGRAIVNAPSVFRGVFVMSRDAGIRPGVGEFTLDLRYPGCFQDDPARPFFETTMALPFLILPER